MVENPKKLATSFFDEDEYKPTANEKKIFTLLSKSFPPLNPSEVLCQGELSLSEDPKNTSHIGIYALTKTYLYNLKVSFSFEFSLKSGFSCTGTP